MHDADIDVDLTCAHADIDAHRARVDPGINIDININGVPLWIAPPKKRAPSGGAGAKRRRTFVLQLRITTPHYGHLILQMAVYAL